MKKKIVFAVVLAAILATGTAFGTVLGEDPRPDKFGIGAMWGSSGAWCKFGDYGFGSGPALALKFEGVPLYFGVDSRIGRNLDHFSVGVTADYNLAGGIWVSDFFGWYVDIGGYLNFWAHINHWSRFNLGLRVPLGLEFNFEVVDVFLAFVPSIGLGVRVKRDKNVYKHPFLFDDGWGFNVGVRVWLPFD